MRTKDTTVETEFNPILTAYLFSLDAFIRKNTDDPDEEVVITAGSEHDQHHGRKSLHYNIPGQAADTWIPLIPFHRIRYHADLFCESKHFPKDWIDLVLDPDHIHHEFQPKKLTPKRGSD